MKNLHFSGPISFGDANRVSEDERHGSVFIGGIDVVYNIDDIAFSGPVTVGIADKRFTGDLEIEFGWGYSEYTPMDSDSLKVGEHDLLEILGRFAEGEFVQLWVSDGPINLLEESE